MSIEQYEKVVKNHKSYELYNVVLKGKVISAGSTISIFKQEGQYLFEFEMEDGTGDLYIYYLRTVPERKVREGDRVVVQGKAVSSQITIGQFLAEKITFE